MAIEWVTPPGEIDREKECGLQPVYDCDHGHPGDGKIDFWLEVNSYGSMDIMLFNGVAAGTVGPADIGWEAYNQIVASAGSGGYYKSDGAEFTVLNCDLYKGHQLVGKGNAVGEHVSVSKEGHVYGVVGVITDLQTPYPRGGLHDRYGTATLLQISFTVRARNKMSYEYADRTFWIGVYHNWSADRDKFIIENLGQAHLDALQADGYCNN